MAGCGEYAFDTGIYLSLALSFEFSPTRAQLAYTHCTLHANMSTRDVRFVERGQEHSAAWQRQQAEAAYVPGTDYSMPRDQHADQSIDWTGLFRASAHEPIPSSNKGYMLLQKMGWSGTGLGRSTQGVHSC
jgi:G-patch domain